MIDYYYYIVYKIKGFPLKAKSFRNTATYQKLKGGGGGCNIIHGGDMTLLVHPRVKNRYFELDSLTKICSNYFLFIKCPVNTIHFILFCFY